MKKLFKVAGWNTAIADLWVLVLADSEVAALNSVLMMTDKTNYILDMMTNVGGNGSIVANTNNGNKYLISAV